MNGYAPYARTPEGRATELIWACDALAEALQHLRLDPTVERAEAVAAHLHAMHRAARVLAEALGREVCA